jgi:aryl-alcohol dehydrogenase-like predicted oxidoreductase
MITLGGDVQVGRIGYGAMRLTGPDLWGEYPDRDGGIARLRGAVDAGVTLIDTADVYGPHSNEARPGDPTDTSGPDVLRRVLGGIAARHPATTSLDHLRENLAAQDLGLTDEDIWSIDGLVPDDPRVLSH